MLAVRFLLQKIGCSRRITFLLWLIVAFRLVCPVSFGNGLSVFNLFNNRGAEYSKNFENTAAAVQVITINTPTAKNTATAKNAAAAIWLFGTAVLLILGVAAYIRLDRRLRFATKYSDDIFVAENISSSFVFGIFRPKIYIPAHICSEQLPYIIAHEKMHIKKLHHIIKLFAYMLLAVHWFNPINVILFRIFEDDMELCCDECVINGRNAEYKNGNFNPERDITNEEIVKMLVCLLGYDTMAEYMSGYPAGYNAVASQLEITSSLELIPNTPAIRSDVGIMVCNSLDVPLAEKKNDIEVTIADEKNGTALKNLRQNLQK